MTQPPKGPGALPLLLRLSMLRSRHAGGGSLAERGYSLAVALIASFVLLLGVGALASRSQLGFVGQVFQVQNRQARDVAESAIAEFVNTMNQESNRHILVSGNEDVVDNISDGTDWPLASRQNLCTAFNSDGSSTGGGVLPVTAAIDRFIPESGPHALGDGEFQVEEIVYLDNQRNGFDSSDTGFRSVILAGGNRTLIRVTVLATVPQTLGRTSRARISREFEVVPKCCKRSFPENQIGAVNWGRDDRNCDVVDGEGNDGIIVGMNGGTIAGSGGAASREVYGESNDPITQALCWGGNVDNSNSDLTATDAQIERCTDGEMSLGNPGGEGGGTGISFASQEFDFKFKDFGGDLPTPLYYSGLTIPNNRTRFITYYDTTDVNGEQITGIGFCEESGGVYDDCRRLDGILVSSIDQDDLTLPPDPCYQEEPLSIGDSRPFHIYNCLTGPINFGNSNSNLRIDTSVAQINLMFYDPTFSGRYFNSKSQSVDVQRVHCRPNQSVIPSPNQACDTFIEWDRDVDDTASVAANDFRYRCAVSGCEGLEYDNRRLLNIWAKGSGEFRINGSAVGVGFNFYAPFSDVRINGGGNRDPNFMGRLWVNNLTLNGGVKIASFNSGVDGDGPGGGNPLIDFMVRSFTQSSGF